MGADGGLPAGPAPPCSSGAASAMVCPDPRPQPSSLTFRSPVGHSRPSEAGCPPPCATLAPGGWTWGPQGSLQ